MQEVEAARPIFGKTSGGSGTTNALYLKARNKSLIVWGLTRFSSPTEKRESASHKTAEAGLIPAALRDAASRLRNVLARHPSETIY